MKISDLKKGLWGYQRESVYQYIAALNEEFSQKLLEKEEEHKSVIQELREKNAVMENELETMRMENNEYRKLRFSVSDSILDAQNFAARMKDETQRTQQDLRNQMEAHLARKRTQLEERIVEMDEFQKALRTMIENIDASIENHVKRRKK